MLRIGEMDRRLTVLVTREEPYAIEGIGLNIVTVVRRYFRLGYCRRRTPARCTASMRLCTAILA